VAIQKDVERHLEVLQTKFVIIGNPCRYWNMEVIFNRMFTCCILQNMILEDEKDVERLENIISELQEDVLPFQRGLAFDQLVTSTIELENEDTHYGL
jgi:hypothetical protein